MVKDILIEFLKTPPLGVDKIIVDIRDIKEIAGNGWDFTLIHRPKEDPFGNNEISFHNFISNKEYDSFEVEYLKEEERKKTEFAKVRVFREKYKEAAEEYQKFMTQNTVEKPTKFDSISEEAVYVTTERAHNPKDSFKQIEITFDNVEEYKKLTANMTQTQTEYQDSLVKFHKNETI